MSERTHVERMGPGRRHSDQVCPLHYLLHDENEKDHGTLCAKVGSAAVKTEELERSKASRKEFWAVVCIIIGVMTSIIGGTFAWLRSDLKEGFSVVHRRITEGAETREHELKEIKSEIRTMTATQQVMLHRVGTIEQNQKK